MGTDTLNEDEVTIISAVLELSEKSVRDIMTPIEDTYSLSSEQVLDEETVNEVRFSRVFLIMRVQFEMTGVMS